MISTITSVLIWLSMLFGGGVANEATQSALTQAVPYWAQPADQVEIAEIEPQLLLALNNAYQQLDQAARLEPKDDREAEKYLFRYQEQMQHAFQIAAGLQEYPGLPNAMRQIEIQLERQERRLQQLQKEQPGDPLPIQAQLHQMIQDYQQLCAKANADPAYLRNQFQHQNQVRVGILAGACQNPEQVPCAPLIPVDGTGRSDLGAGYRSDRENGPQGGPIYQGGDQRQVGQDAPAGNAETNRTHHSVGSGPGSSRAGGGKGGHSGGR